MKFKDICTFTGFNSSNAASKLGNQNIWINSKSYNYVENTHKILLLMLVDSIKKSK